MPQILPYTSDPSQSFTVPLEGGAKFLIEARWNDVAGFWTFDVTAEPSQVRLVAGCPILIGQDMLKPYALGIGGLVATDTSGAGIDAGVDDLGDRVTVTWLSNAELAIIPGPTPLVYVPPAVVVPVVPVVPPPFTPLALGSTLKLWLRGDLGVTQSGGIVSAWADQSGNGKNVANVGTVPYAASSINGLPGITCATNAGMQNSSSLLVAAGGPRTLYFVVKASSNVGGVLFCNALSSHTQEAWLLGAGGSVPGLVYSSDGTSRETIPTPTISGVPLLLSVSTTGGAGATVTCAINGAVQSVTNSVATFVETGAAGFGIGILPYFTSSLGWIGDIDEVIGCDTVISGASDTLVKTYLSQRYGIAVV